MTPPTIFVDARCLQDDDYRFRGVGQHSSGMLSEARSVFARRNGVRLVALLDPAMLALAPEHAALFDRLQLNGYANPTPNDWFIALSPMTHSPMRVARMLTRKAAKTAAIVYDFIPHENPDRYLPTQAAKIEYLNNLSWLKQYGLFLPISDYSGRRAIEVLGVRPELVHTSGVAVRASLVSPKGPQRPGFQGDHVLVVGGGDTRKNAECAIVAHGQSRLAHDRATRLVIAGNYPQDMANGLRALHAQNGGDPNLLTFLGKVTDAELAELYRDSILTICPSRTEGFSIPVVEANANGCPVIISNCPAQTELIPFPEDQFDPDDHARVTLLMEAMARDPAVRAQAAARQKDIWRRFEARAVGERFWAPFLDTQGLETQAKTQIDLPRFSVRRGAKPRIAVISPLPPDKSGVADYTAACLESLAKSAEVHVFTETREPAPSAAYTALEPLSPLPYLSGRYDAVVSVIGNSHFHLRPLELLLDYGGAAIAHDARMINFYAVLHGAERATAIASREMARPVDWREVEGWLHNQRRLPTLFLSEILDAAQPTIVHSKITQAIIKNTYNKTTQYLPFSTYRLIPDSACSPAAKSHSRRILGLPNTAFLFSTFGGVGPDKAPEACIWALQQLRGWGVDARLAFVGGASSALAANLRVLAEELGVEDSVILFPDSVDEATFRHFLSASDMAVQLRGYGMGGLSGSVLDCIAAGLPAVVNEHLAESMEAPGFVRRIPDAISPLLLAEQLLAGFESNQKHQRPLDERRIYMEARSFDAYATKLLGVLGLGT